MRIGKQFNISGNANVVAHEVHIYVSPAIRRQATAFDRRTRAVATVILAVVFGLSTINFDDNPALVAGLGIALLLSSALLLREEKTDGAVEQRPERNLQHDSEGRGRE